MLTRSRRVTLATAAGALLVAATLHAQTTRPQQSATTVQMTAEQVIASWKPMPKEVAQKIIAKYGQPSEVATNRLVWHNNGPWALTELVNEEIPHDFPMPHKDMLYQAIAYKVDPEDGDDLLKYDGSVILERTKGMIAARCDKEEANFLAINLAHDVATGERDVDDARRFYADSIATVMKGGKPNDYMTGFRFTAAKSDQGDRDTPFGPVGTSGRE
jgi:hypothetical protein